MKWHIQSAGPKSDYQLVWFHGFMGSSKDWLGEISSPFSDYTNIYIDLPGHGQSRLMGTETYQALLTGLKDQLLQLNAKKTILIGYSMGGRVALHFQHLFPEWVHAFVGLSTAPGLRSQEEREQRQAADEGLIHKLREQGFEKFLQLWYGLPLFHTIKNHPELLRSLTQSRANNDPEQLGLALKALGNGALPSLWPNLEQVNIPTLLGCGGEDSKYGKITDEMQLQLPLAETFTISGASHAFHLEKPLETAAAIRHFLSNTI